MDMPLKINHHYQTAPFMQAGILAAKNKGEVIAAMASYISSQGGFSDAPPEVREKLQKLTK